MAYGGAVAATSSGRVPPAIDQDNLGSARGTLLPFFTPVKVVDRRDLIKGVIQR
jgi:hypothetical protein